MLRIEKDKLDESKVKDHLTEAAMKKYPDAKIEGWVREKNNVYGVFFQQKIWTKYAKFSAEGEWLETIVFSVSKQLPPVVEKTLNEEYPKGYKVIDFQTILNNANERTYEMVLRLRDKEVELKLDGNGVILNNIKYDGSKTEYEEEPALLQEELEVVEDDDIDNNNDGDDDLLEMYVDDDNEEEAYEEEEE
ncbi:MAG: PepSY-like domain-containing protein [Sphingobacteriales bacterium]|nr:PepSY-like domain-containing protein [Sphingobacteriales bacterium]